MRLYLKECDDFRGSIETLVIYNDFRGCNIIEREYISETIIYQCVQKYDANFCYKIIAVCASMYSVPYTEGPVQRLPQNVVKCLYSNDVLVLCRAKHGTAFCNNLAAACSKLTNIPVPQITPDVAYVLPKPVADCMQKGSNFALAFGSAFREIRSGVIGLDH
ncbi:unnamed protein product [Anisakis simplex]|uniref:Proteasome assembly chaperone 1 n=1 Tax=Anisakis simplex TaxID=6269 RepID=A0A0M3JHM2_ANISI|nr:unnamed protein product [Anisakis simplex]